MPRQDRSKRRVRFPSLVVVVGALMVVAASLSGVSAPKTPTVTLRSAELTGDQFPGTFATYNPAELWGGGSPADTCFVCNSETTDGVGTAAQSVQPDQSINPATGDFSTSNTLFSVPDLGQPLEFSLDYSSDLAQNQQQTNQSYAGAFGWGWGSNFNLFESNSSGTVTISQPNGAQNQFSLPGSQDSCPVGDYEDPQKYTLASSTELYCAPQRVDAQLGLLSSGSYELTEDGGKNTYIFNGTTGSLAYIGDNNFAWDQEMASSVSPGTGKCPSNASSCITTTDLAGRVITQAVSAYGLVFEVVDPAGNDYTMGFDGGAQLTSVVNVAHANATWTYGYAGSSKSLYNEDLTSIEDPLTNVTKIGYTSSAPLGYANALTDAAGATTNYTYTNTGCTDWCLNNDQSQVTDVKYPDSEFDTDHYFEGLLTGSAFGNASAQDANFESWTYNYQFPTVYNQDGDTYEEIVHPGAAQSVSTTVVTTDSVGNVLSSQDAEGQVTDTMYNDVGGNDFDELCWSARPVVSVPANATCSTPPAGSTHYTYDSNGNLTSETDPLGNTTRYGYYVWGTGGDYYQGLLCWVAPPSVTGTGAPCTASTPGVNAPTGSTAYSYDEYTDLTSKTVNWNASPSLTTTSGYTTANIGQLAWTIPPAGQSGTQASTNPYATSYTYDAWGQVKTTTVPDAGAVTDSYDADGNLISVGGPMNEAASYGYDVDGRRCWSLVGTSGTTGNCTTTVPKYSTVTTYEPGTDAPLSVADPNGNTTTYTYGDPAYPTSPTEVKDPLSQEITYTAYNAYGNACVTGPVQPAFDTTTQCNQIYGDTADQYNADGTRLASWDADGNQTTYGYGGSAAAGYDDLVTSVTTPMNQTTNYTYDNDGRLVLTSNPNGTYTLENYDADSRVCAQSTNQTQTLGCGSSTPTGNGVTSYTYDGASELTAMQDNYGMTPATPETQYTYSNGNLTQVTDDNAKTVSYLYGYGGEVLCVAYPMSSGTSSCGTISSRGTPSSSNMIANYAYDTALRVHTITSWASTNPITYTYGDAYNPDDVTNIAYPTTSAESLAYTYDKAGNLSSATYSGPVLNGKADTFTYDADERLSTTSLLGGTTTPAVGYNSYKQITSAENPGQTSADAYATNPNGEILQDAGTSGEGTTGYYYNTDGGVCYSVPQTTGPPPSNACTNPPSGATTVSYDQNGQRTSSTNGTTTTSYGWNSFGQMCWVAPTSSSTESCSSAPAGATSYTYGGNGLRMTSTSNSVTTDYTWDTVRGGTIPLDISDGTNDYVYGPLLFGGTAPVEQISGSSASFLASTQTGVQDVFNSSGTEQERASYSLYGIQSIVAGSKASPFGFQGSYTDSSGLIYLINRYYDPTTDQFLSVDPDVAETGQPYTFSGGDPLNASDPLGLCNGPDGMCRNENVEGSHYTLNSSVERSDRTSSSVPITPIYGSRGAPARLIEHATETEARHGQTHTAQEGSRAYNAVENIPGVQQGIEVSEAQDEAQFGCHGLPAISCISDASALSVTENTILYRTSNGESIREYVDAIDPEVSITELALFGGAADDAMYGGDPTADSLNFTENEIDLLNDVSDFPDISLPGDDGISTSPNTFYVAVGYAVQG